MAKNRALFLVADLGAGNVKLWTSKRGYQKYIMPSLIAWVDKKTMQEGHPDIYNTGAFIQEDKCWIVGEDILVGDFSADNPGKDANLKLKNALPLLLSALINGNYLEPEELNYVGLVVSHHDAVNMAAPLKESIEGEHSVEKAGKPYRVDFNFLTETAVYGEGSMLKIATSSPFGSLDLGYLTSLYKRRRADGSVLKNYKDPSGVNKLIDLMVNDSDFSKITGGVTPNRERIIRGILECSENVKKQQLEEKEIKAEQDQSSERKGSKKKAQKSGIPMMYRTEDNAVDIKSIYVKCLATWVKDAAKQATDQLKAEVGTGFKVIAIGGGCELPGLAPFLQNLGIQIYEGDPLFANAESLYKKVVKEVRRDKQFQDWDIEIDASDLEEAA